MNCQNAKPLISEYIDNSLSARDTWELDKHFAECNPCALQLNEMRETVNVLAAAPRFEVPNDFMAKLQGRISALEPETPRQTWITNLREFFRPGFVRPAWGAALGTAALALIILFPRPSVTTAPQGVIAPPMDHNLVSVTRTQNISMAASDPLGDTAAASMAGSNSSDQGTQNPAAESL
jgi:anti-sigma factor RsiW